MADTKVVYDEKAIKTLDALAHIRLRTGMYVGRLGDGSHPQDGIYVLLKEVVDNSVDEFIVGAGRKIEIRREGPAVTVRDYGRGIPLGKVIDCVSKINTGGKFSDDVFQFSVGLNGVGTKAVNALSSEFEVTSFREGKYVFARFERGSSSSRRRARARAGTERWSASFPTPPSSRTTPGTTSTSSAGCGTTRTSTAASRSSTTARPLPARTGSRTCSPRRSASEPTIYRTIYFKDKHLEFAFTHTTNYGEAYYSFVNGQYTIDGGTHQSAFREGVLRGVNEFAGNSFSGEDVREGLVGAIAVKLKDPVFESQTKNKLGSTEVRTWIVNEVRNQLMLWLHKYPVEAKALVEKVRTNERVRKELATLKKEARERARKVAIRIPKLTDCKIHYDTKERRREQSSIFLAEGDSAGGNLIQARDVNTQAVFSLRGKPPNTFGLGQDAVYKNEELYNVMRALGIENDIGRPALQQGHHRNRCRRRRHAHPQPPAHLLPEVLRGAGPHGARIHPRDAPVPRPRP